MKSFKKVALAAAVACVAAGNAFAVVDLDAGTGAVSYAKELTTNGTVLTDALNTTVKLGFGVSNGQTRYIRYDLGNATWGTAITATDLVIASATDVVSAGGGINDTYVIFQITATADTASSVAVALSNATGVKLTSATNGATITYSLYETAADAVNGTASGRLAVASNKTIAGVVKSTALTVTTASATADVTELYKKFTAATAIAGSGQLTAKIGEVTLGLRDVDGNTAGVQLAKDPATGNDVALAQLFGAASKLVIATNKSWASVSDIYLSTDASCGGVGTSDADAQRTATTTAIVVGATAVPVARGICYVANGTAAIDAQDFTVSGVFTTGEDLVLDNGKADDESAVALGSFDRDGTILKAAFTESAVGGFGNVVHLTNTSGNAAGYTTSCLTFSGRVAGLGGSVAANSATRIGINSASGLGCPSNTRGIELTLSVPKGSVIGSVVRQNATTGQASYDSMVGSQ